MNPKRREAAVGALEEVIAAAKNIRLRLTTFDNGRLDLSESGSTWQEIGIIAGAAANLNETLWPGEGKGPIS